MPHHLMNLRHVPDDEAEEIRALFEAHQISYYETPPSRWGISMGGFWVHDKAEAARAKALLTDYQAERQARLRAEWDQACAEGRAPGLWQRFRDKPATVLAALLAVLLVLGLSLLPFMGW
ncbi:MAG: DUF6164 family protein [Marinobacter sp.]|nr:DUF6164 family protein [Marinobacter sp.]